MNWFMVYNSRLVMKNWGWLLYNVLDDFRFLVVNYNWWWWRWRRLLLG